MMADPKGFILLGEVAAHLAVLDVACNRCQRKGRVLMGRLMAEHGPLMPIPTLLAVLSGDCPKRQAERMLDVCGAHLPQLPSIFLTKPAG
jgi:hypothetical protein